MKKAELLKVIAWAGFALIALVMFFDTNPSQYFLEIGGVVLVLLYAYNKIKSKTLILVLTLVFSVLYIFVPSIPDLIFWGLLFALTI